MFVIAIGIANSLGFNSTIKTTALIFPVILISILLLFVGNLDNFSLSIANRNAPGKLIQI